MSRSKSTVRIGPISLFTLAVALCLAVMAVLSITTAQATFAAADKQATFTRDTYDNERSAQEMLATIDAALAPVRAANGGLYDALSAVGSVLPSEAQLEGPVVHATFTTEHGRTLNVEITIRANATFEINAWKASTEWTTTADSETLWSGAPQTS